MKILVHDFAGHPFQFQLSEELARRGHEVKHAYFADLPGPKGKLSVNAAQASRLSVEPLKVTKSFHYYSYWQRLHAHNEYVALLKARIAAFQPDVVLSGNAPTDIQYRLNRECVRRKIRFVHWIQDFYALALEILWSRKVGILAKAGAAPFHFLERRIFERSDEVVYISEDFSSWATSARYLARKSVVIENWASIEDLPAGPKDNGWAREQGLDDKFVFLYSGTMGLKHDPHLLAELANRFKGRPQVRVVLVSQGVGRDVLEQRKRKEGLDNLLLFDFQPYERLPEVLASASVLLANVEPESSAFCVPSKILNYLCAGRPILMSVPPGNLAARVIARAQAGFSCEPGNAAAFLEAAEMLWKDQERCEQLGRHARAYAEATFDITKIGGLFEEVLSGNRITARLPGSVSNAEFA